MKTARILFPIGLPEPFDYAIPEGVSLAEGSYVTAPLGKTERTGVVWGVLETADPERELKPISAVYPASPMPKDMRDFIDLPRSIQFQHPVAYWPWPFARAAN